MINITYSCYLLGLVRTGGWHGGAMVSAVAHSQKDVSMIVIA